MPKRGSDIRHTEACHQELGQLDDPGDEIAHVTREIGVVHLLGEVRVELSHHGHARGRRCDDNVSLGEDPHESTSKSRRGILVSRVEVQLATTRLRLRKLDVVPEPLENADGRDSRLGEKRVVETREEERDTHGGAS